MEESIEISGDPNKSQLTVKELVEGQLALPLALLPPILFTASHNRMFLSSTGITPSLPRMIQAHKGKSMGHMSCIKGNHCECDKCRDIILNNPSI